MKRILLFLSVCMTTTVFCASSVGGKGSMPPSPTLSSSSQGSGNSAQRAVNKGTPGWRARERQVKKSS